MKIAIGSDHAGFPLKQTVMAELQELGHEVTDLGAFTDAHAADDYHFTGVRVAETVVSGQADRGIVICGTGIGISIAANKIPGADVALCNDLYTAQKSREHNNANVLAMGSRVVGEGLAKEIVRVWLATPYAGGRHEARNLNLRKIEARYSRTPQTGSRRASRGKPAPLRGRLVDLSQLIYPSQEEYRFDAQVYPVSELLPQYHTPVGQWYVMTEVTLWSHVGTHIESPLHYIKDGPDVADLPLEQLIGPAVVLDFSHKQTNEPIQLEELREAGDVQVGDIVILKTGRDRLYRTPQAHDRPYLAVEATHWLAEDRRIALLGTDASGFEVRGIDTQPNHQILFERGIPVIEHLTNLSSLTRSRVTLIVLPWKARGLDSCPVRVVAFEEE
ncbi:MAG: ribose 5-phosphate isomerase B [Anaerolineales bacterium]|jgi:RpiB/LacA/LacB family sugar-phosphate isomerase